MIDLSKHPDADVRADYRRLVELIRHREGFMAEALRFLGRPASTVQLNAWEHVTKAIGYELVTKADENGMTQWYAIQHDLNEYGQKYGDEIHALANKLNAPASYWQMAQDMANDLVPPLVRAAGDNLLGHLERLEERFAEVRPVACGQVPPLAPDTAEPARRTA